MAKYRAKTLMIQGTASHVGKSLIAAGLCRLFMKQGYRVAPFKAQNMSNNSFAVLGGGEMGRAQASQAQACGLQPSVLMNPILLKPATDHQSQVVVMGRAHAVLSAVEYQNYKKKLVPVVRDSLHALMQSYDLVVIEGAGSPAEINLKKQDIVNMAVAKMVSAPVILTGDIDKGGVFAQLIGTYELLDPVEKKLTRAFLINKFRGDKKILQPGLKWIEKRTSRKVLGVLPFLQNHEIPEEDSIVLQESLDPGSLLSQGQFGARFRVESLEKISDQLLIHVIQLPRISNFTDFEPLSKEKDVILQYIQKPNRHCLPDLIIIPGSKSTMADLRFLKEAGFADYLERCVKAGTTVLGICGGYQMLGESILDPQHVEASQSQCKGLGLLPTVTVFKKEKTTAQVKAVHLESRLEIEGYEIHSGCTQGRVNSVPIFKVIERHGMPIEDFDGMMHHNDSHVLGTYIHGLFDKPEFRRYFLNKLRGRAGLKNLTSPPTDQVWGRLFTNGKETGVPPFQIQKAEFRGIPNPYDRLAEMLENNMDIRLLKRLVNL
jgi:adenosylcobyric acid synthase